LESPRSDEGLEGDRKSEYEGLPDFDCGENLWLGGRWAILCLYFFTGSLRQSNKSPLEVRNLPKIRGQHCAPSFELLRKSP
jgi:hypothetical protein